MEDVRALRPFDRVRVLDAIGRGLRHEPTAPTRQRKRLEAGVEMPFETEGPVWQLRVGDYRIFYDVDEEEKKVRVRAVRRKPSHRTTEEVL